PLGSAHAQTGRPDKQYPGHRPREGSGCDPALRMSADSLFSLRISVYSDQGGRKYMEDVTQVVIESEAEPGEAESEEEEAVAGGSGGEPRPGVAFFAVFDGHGGREAAVFARDNLWKCIKKQRGFLSEDPEEFRGAIRKGFIACHYAMWKKLPEWPKTMTGLPSTSGTTASVVIICRNKMYVAHVGDSGVVLGAHDGSSEGRGERDRVVQALEVTQDHKPELPKEKERIEGLGGSVINKSGVNRVVWKRPRLTHNGPEEPGPTGARLLVTRALGRWRQRMLRADNTSAVVICIDPPSQGSERLCTEELWLKLTNGSIHQMEESSLISSSPSTTPSRKASDDSAPHWFCSGFVPILTRRDTVCGRSSPPPVVVTASMEPGGVAAENRVGEERKAAWANTSFKRTLEELNGATPVSASKRLKPRHGRSSGGGAVGSAKSMTGCPALASRRRNPEKPAMRRSLRGQRRLRNLLLQQHRKTICVC
ncbi:hypothetical protein scyTo_0007456, partial [Scyliorhinus torazame]|nr:hypothetical protein [Scyliorhinus torazame]